MNRCRVVVFGLAMVVCVSSIAAPSDVHERIFENDRLGKIVFLVPDEWETYDRHHINFGTTVLSGKNRKVEEFEISFNDAARMQFKWASETELREFIFGQMQQYVSQSVEQKPLIKVQHGANVVVYSTLTDRNPKAGEFKFITLGAARTGDMVFLVFHLTNDPRRIERVVSAVAGAKRAPK